jgi:hypothetical protein
MFDDISNDELKKQLAEYQRANAPSGHQYPDAPGCSHLKPELRDTAATLYGASIMKKKADEITPSEVDFLRKSVLAALREL